MSPWKRLWTVNLCWSNRKTQWDNFEGVKLFTWSEGQRPTERHPRAVWRSREGKLWLWLRRRDKTWGTSNSSGRLAVGSNWETSLFSPQEMFLDRRKNRRKNIRERWSLADDPIASLMGTGGGATGLEPSRCYYQPVTNNILKSCWKRRWIVKLCWSSRTTQRDNFLLAVGLTQQKKKSNPPRKHRYLNHDRPVTTPLLKDAFLLSSNQPSLLKVAARMEKTDGLKLPSDNETRWATVRRYIKKKQNQNKRFTEMSRTFLTFRHQSRQQGMQGADGHV